MPHRLKVPYRIQFTLVEARHIIYNNIIICEMAVFNVAGYLVEERRRWPVWWSSCLHRMSLMTSSCVHNDEMSPPYRCWGGKRCLQLPGAGASGASGRCAVPSAAPDRRRDNDLATTPSRSSEATTAAAAATRRSSATSGPALVSSGGTAAQAARRVIVRVLRHSLTCR